MDDEIILAGGSPCTDFSFAGKGKGMSTTTKVEVLSLNHYLKLKAENFEFEGQSYLFWEYMRLKNELNPKWFLLENVDMIHKWRTVLSRAIGVNAIDINSSLVSAQNRQRLYWTNIYNEPQGLFGDLECMIPQPKDKGITWGDVREKGVNSQKYYYTKKAMQWLGRHSRKKNKLLSIHLDSEKMQMIEASHHKKYSSQRFFGILDLPDNEQAVAAMRGRYLINGVRQDGKQLTEGLTEQYIEFRYDGKTNSLTTVAKDNVVVPFTLPNRIPANEFFFRYITPRECGRLQTCPEDKLEIILGADISDSRLYHIWGNGWTIDVIAHILSFIK